MDVNHSSNAKPNLTQQARQQTDTKSAAERLSSQFLGAVNADASRSFSALFSDVGEPSAHRDNPTEPRAKEKVTGSDTKPDERTPSKSPVDDKQINQGTDNKQTNSKDQSNVEQQEKAASDSRPAIDPDGSGGISGDSNQITDVKPQIVSEQLSKKLIPDLTTETSDEDISPKIFDSLVDTDETAVADEAVLISPVLSEALDGTNPSEASKVEGEKDFQQRQTQMKSNLLDAQTEIKDKILLKDDRLKAEELKAEGLKTETAKIEGLLAGGKPTFETMSLAGVKELSSNRLDNMLNATQILNTASTPHQIAKTGNLPVNLGAFELNFTKTFNRNEAWSKGFAQQVSWLANNNIQRAHINLDPKDLGPVKIDLQIHKEHTSLVFTSHSQSVRDALEVNLYRIRDQLQEQGFTNVQAQVRDEHQQSAREQHSEHRPDNQQASKLDEKIETDEQVMMHTEEISIVNYYI